MEKTTERDIQIRAAKAYPILTEIAPENDLKNAQFLAYIKGATEQREIDEEALSKVKDVYHKAGYEQGYAKAIEKAYEWWRVELDIDVDDCYKNWVSDVLNEFEKAMNK